MHTAKEPELEGAPLTHLIGRIKCRTSRSRLRVIPKWPHKAQMGGNIRSGRRRKSPSPDRRTTARQEKARRTPSRSLEATSQTVTITRRKVAGMEVPV